MQWIFPDEAYSMNRQPKRFTEIMTKSLDAQPGQESPWAEHERSVAMDRVKNREKAERGMEGKLNTTERSQRYERPASRSAVPNGVFHGSPMDYSTSGNAFRGGRIYTKEGQEWLAKRLQQRIGEYDAISTGNFSKGAPQPIEVSPYTTVDTLFQQLFASFSAGSFTSGTATALNSLLSEILKIGATVTPGQLTTYAQSAQKLTETIRGYRAGEVGVDFERRGLEAQAMRELGGERDPVLGALLAANPAEERLRAIQSMQSILKVINGAIREIARTINDPVSSRQQVMRTLQQRLLGEQLAAYNPAFAEEARQAAVRAVPGEFPLGGEPRGRTLTGPTFAEEQAQQRGEEEGAQNLGREMPGELAALADYVQDVEGQYGNLAGLGKKRRGRPRKY
jgi:hypothetical protein